MGANYEFAVVDQFSIQTQLIYDYTFYFNSKNINTLSTLSLGLEPRYYYNFNKRNGQGKNTKHNSANFISLGVRYSPDLLTAIDTKTKVTINKQSSINPMWNIRRNISNSNFNYEFGIGMSFGTIYYENSSNEKNNNLALNLKIGYSF